MYTIHFTVYFVLICKIRNCEDVIYYITVFRNKLSKPVSADTALRANKMEYLVPLLGILSTSNPIISNTTTY
jgi:hypothetical protein